VKRVIVSLKPTFGVVASHVMSPARETLPVQSLRSGEFFF
jgi:hypothetical protein